MLKFSTINSAEGNYDDSQGYEMRCRPNMRAAKHDLKKEKCVAFRYLALAPRSWPPCDRTNASQAQGLALADPQALKSNEKPQNK